MIHQHAQSGRSRSNGFTLIEVMLALVIMAILAAIMVPRLTGNQKREFELTVDRVADMLIMFAQRDVLGRQPVGIVRHYNDRTDLDRLLLVILEADSDLPGAPSQWVADRFVPPVDLSRTVDPDSFGIYIDGSPVDIIDIPVSHSPGRTRPTIEIEMTDVSGEHHATLILSAHDLAPQRTGVGSGRRTVRRSIDLDREGRSRENW